MCVAKRQDTKDCSDECLRTNKKSAPSPLDGFIIPPVIVLLLLCSTHCALTQRAPNLVIVVQGKSASSFDDKNHSRTIRQRVRVDTNALSFSLDERVICDIFLKLCSTAAQR